MIHLPSLFINSNKNTILFLFLSFLVEASSINYHGSFTEK